jgi:hypothetical protein
MKYVTEDELRAILLNYATNRALNSELSHYQPKQLNVPVKINGVPKVTVEATLNGLNDNFTGTIEDWDNLSQEDKDLYEKVIITNDVVN